MSCGKNIGRIIWFDQKKGFGFVKIMDTEDKEVFFHFSSIQSVNSFKKVYPGEYVSLDIEENTEDTMTLLSKYIEELDTSLDKNRLINLQRQLYTEAQDLEI